MGGGVLLEVDAGYFSSPGERGCGILERLSVKVGAKRSPNSSALPSILCQLLRYATSHL